MARAEGTAEGKLYTLDGLRGFAAIAVVAFHTPGPLQSLAPSAYLAVDLFFALSGFVIAKAYDARIASGLMSIGDFARTRFIRLYPLLFIGAVIAIVAKLGGIALDVANGEPERFAAQIAGLILVAPLTWAEDEFLLNLNVPVWSLFFEIVANLVFVAAFAFFARHLAKVVALAAVALIIAVFSYGSAEIGAEWESFAGGFARVGFSFFAGVLLYRMRDRIKVPALPPWAYPPILIAALAAAPDGVKALYDLVCILVLFPVMIASAARVEPQGALKSSYALLGATSYGIYVLHYPFCRAMNNLDLFTQESPAVMIVAGLALVVGVLALAWVLDRLYDQPARRWLARVLSPSAPEPTPARSERTRRTP